MLQRLDTSNDLPAHLSVGSLACFFTRTMGQYGDSIVATRCGIEKALESPEGEGGYVLLAWSQGKLVGGLVMLLTGMDGYVPGNLLLYAAVDPEMRGQGIGGKLIERAQDESDGDIKLHVEPNNPAVRLYERMGFTNPYLEMRFKRD